MQIVTTLNSTEIISLILEAKKRCIISLPGINAEIANALISKINTVSIAVVVDNSEEVFRNGYGDIEAIDALIEKKVSLKECKGNLVSFVIADDQGYFIFPHSKIFQSASYGPNAIKIDPNTIEFVLLCFIKEGNVSKDELNERMIIANKATQIYLTNASAAIIEKAIIPVANNFDEKKASIIKGRLQINPPLSPDLQRQINTYAAKIQFVELKFTGGNLQNHIATLPDKALPINSEALKKLLNTRIKMFDSIIDTPEFKKFIDFKSRVDQLRTDYLIPITCRPAKSIIKIEDKFNFETKLSELKQEVEAMDILLRQILEKGRLNTLDLLEKELRIYFKETEQIETSKISDPDLKSRMVEDMIRNVLVSVKFPKVEKLIENISISEYFYDLTESVN